MNLITEHISTIEEFLSQIKLEAIKNEDILIKKIRESTVIPFCKKHKLKFESGMGSWNFRANDDSEFDDDVVMDRISSASIPNGGWDWYDEGANEIEINGPENWREIIKILNIPSEIQGGIVLGALMEDYHTNKEKTYN